jgi:2-iminobutanoate/2-iminopropanoate deaminase
MKAISTPSAPAAVGPYSQAMVHGGTLFVSGQLPIDPETGSFAAADPEGQTRQCLVNIAAIAEAAGTGMAHCLKTTVLVRDLSHFAQINAVYATFFTEPYPARATFEVSALPRDALVEIEAVFAMPNPVRGAAHD